jgi:hypothetical protein
LFLVLCLNVFAVVWKKLVPDWEGMCQGYWLVARKTHHARGNSSRSQPESM